jgi:hypothetical protein
VLVLGDDHKCTVFGAVDDASGHVLWQTSARKGEDAFMALLDHLVEALPANEPAVVVLDNAGYHTSHAVRAHWQRLADRLHPFFLPAYAPQLNLLERLWRSLKAKLTCHRWWNDRDHLMPATATLLADLEVHFHADDGPTFRPAHNLCESAEHGRPMADSWLRLPRMGQCVWSQ